jgi:hypothetical protein
MFSSLRSTLAVHRNSLANGFTLTKELKAVNDGWQLVREEGKSSISLKKQVGSAVTVGHD